MSASSIVVTVCFSFFFLVFCRPNSPLAGVRSQPGRPRGGVVPVPQRPQPEAARLWGGWNGGVVAAGEGFCGDAAAAAVAVCYFMLYQVYSSSCLVSHVLRFRSFHFSVPFRVQCCCVQ